MRRYYPIRIGDQIVWLRNIHIKLPTHATVLALGAGEVTAFRLDVANAIYALDDYRAAIGTFSEAAYQRIEEVLNDAVNEDDIVWLDFTMPPGAPAAVAYGCLKRIFAYIDGTITEAASYTTAIGEDLGVEPPAIPTPDPMASPEFTLRITTGGKMEVVWTRGPFDGVKLQFDLGAAGTQNDMDLRPNYTLNWLPATGASAVIKVRLRYLYKGEEFGNWSLWQQWTLTGV